jgi:antirestriction protein ArdC
MTVEIIHVFAVHIADIVGIHCALDKYMKTTTTSRDEKVSSAINAIDAGVAAFRNGDDWMKWLKLQSQFHTYSFNNTMMILLQCPTATRVAGYETWKKAGRQVKKGEKGIPIFAPVGLGKAKERSEETGEERVVRTWLRFKIVYVFDVNQTEGDELPTITRAIPETPFVSNIETLHAVALGLDGIVSSIDVRSREGGDSRTAGGWYCPATKSIVVIDEGSDAAKFRVLVHEVAHAILHGKDDHHGRPEKEVEAESVAFVVCDALGLDTSCKSFGYVASWMTDAGPNAIKTSADRIAKAAKTVLDALLGSTNAD